MKLLCSIAAVLLITAMTLRPAAADNWGRPMLFSMNPHNGAVIADGDITPEAPRLLEQFLTERKVPPGADIELTSRGGNLQAGLEIGEIIRAHNLNTWVLSETPIVGLSSRDTSASLSGLKPLSYPSYCASACTFAFLGGVQRGVWTGSTYAVHQAALECRSPSAASTSTATIPRCPTLEEGIADIQVTYGKLIDYVQRMGADPGFLTEMVQAPPE